MQANILQLLTSVLQVFLGLVGLSLVVLVHEFGHYVAARTLGIRVETFSIGFGRRIVGFRRGETDYKLSLIPLGGYCRFYGEDSFRKALDEKLPSIPSEEGDFYAAKPWRRIIVAIAGPLANFIFAILVFTIIFWIGFTEQYREPRIVLNSEISTVDRLWPADKAGLETGDIIVAFDGHDIRSFSDLAEGIAVNPGKEMDIIVDRNGRNIALTVIPELNKESGYAQIGVRLWTDPIVSEVIPDSAADFSGLQVGDIIRSVNDVALSYSFGLYEAIEANQGVILELEVLRGGVIRGISYNTSLIDKISGTGIVFPYTTGRSLERGFFDSLKEGFVETNGILGTTVRGMRMMFMGIKMRNAVSGPARLVNDTGSIVMSGFSLGFGPGLYWTFRFLAIISISLAFLNLLPIPIMDGGQILLFATEWIRKKPIHPGSVYRYQFVGTIIVLIIFVAASTGDVLHFSGR